MVPGRPAGGGGGGCGRLVRRGRALCGQRGVFVVLRHVALKLVGATEEPGRGSLGANRAQLCVCVMHAQNTKE